MNENAGNCSEHLNKLGPIYRQLFYTNAVHENGGPVIWTKKTPSWTAIHISTTAFCSLLYLCLGVVAVYLLATTSSRLKAKTVSVIYTCIALLGFSRLLFSILDPYGTFGWITDHFLPWIIISRLLAGIGFPCITASYTLIFLTIWKANELGKGKWINKWKQILLITGCHFLVTILTQTLAYISPDTALAATIVCDGGFIVWGLIISGIFIIAGTRLVRSINIQLQKTTSAAKKYSPNEHKRIKNRMAPVIQKVMRITYATAILEIIYVSVNIVSLGLVINFITKLCFGLNGLGNSYVWLVVHILKGVLEIALSLTILYSVTNVPKFVQNVKSCILSCIASIK